MGQAQLKECKPCSLADPATATVNVDPTLLSALSDEVLPVKKHMGTQQQEQQADLGSLSPQHDEGEAQEQDQHEEGMSPQADEQQQEQQQQEQRLECIEEQHEKPEQHEQQHEQQLEQKGQSEGQTPKIIAVHEQAAKAEQEIEEIADVGEEQAEIAEARRQVDLFLRSQGFKDVCVPRKKCCRSCYALHRAVDEDDAAMVRALLLCGADPTVKNSSSQTPRQLAEKRNRRGSHQAVLAALAGVPVAAE